MPIPKPKNFADLFKVMRNKGLVNKVAQPNQFFRGVEGLSPRSWNRFMFSLSGNPVSQQTFINSFLDTGVKHLPMRTPELELEMTREIGNAMQKHAASGMPMRVAIAETFDPVRHTYLPRPVYLGGTPEEVGRVLFGMQNGSVDLSRPPIVRLQNEGEGDYGWEPNPRTPLRTHRMFGEKPGHVLAYGLAPASNPTAHQGLMFDTLSGENPYTEIPAEVEKYITAKKELMDSALENGDYRTFAQALADYQSLPSQFRDPSMLQRMQLAFSARTPEGQLFDEYNKQMQKAVASGLRSGYQKTPEGIKFTPGQNTPLSGIDLSGTGRHIGTYYLRPDASLLEVPVDFTEWRQFRNGTKSEFTKKLDLQIRKFFQDNGLQLPAGYETQTPLTTDYLMKIVGDIYPKSVLKIPHVNDFHGAYQGYEFIANPLKESLEFPPLFGIRSGNLEAATKVDQDTVGLYKPGGKITRFKSKLHK